MVKKVEPLLDLGDLTEEGVRLSTGSCGAKTRSLLICGILFVVLSDACRKRRNIKEYCLGKAEHFSKNRLNPDPPGMEVQSHCRGSKTG